MAREPVGQVYIRVSPDTTGFAGETRRELKKLKSLDRVEHPVQLKLDTEQLNDDFDDIIGRLQLKALDEDYRIKIFTELHWDAREARKQMAASVEKYEALAKGQKVEIGTDLDDHGALSGEPVSRKVNLDVDESEFRSELNKVLASAKAKVKVDVDKKSFTEEAAAAVKELRTVWDMAFNKNKLRLDLDINAADLGLVEEQLSRVRKEYLGNAEAVEASARELRRVTNEYNNISRKIGSIRAEIEHMDKTSAEDAERIVKLMGDINKLNKQQAIFDAERRRLIVKGQEAHVALALDRESVVELEAEYEALQRSLESKTAEIGVGISEIDFRVVASRLAALVRPRVALIIAAMSPQSNKAIAGLERIGRTNWGRIGKIVGGFAGRTTGIRLLWQTARDMLDIVPKLDMMIPQLAQTSALAATAISGAVGLIGSAVSVGMDMIKSLQVGLIAPAGLAGLATVGLVLYSAFRDLNTVLPSVGERFSALRDIASDSFWGAGKPQIAEFFDVLLTSLERWTPAVSKQVGLATGALADGLREGLATHADRFFENLNAGLETAKGGLKSLGRAFMGLIGAGSDSFADLGTWFSKVMADFDEWVGRNDANGNITKWIEEGAQAIRDIGSLIYSTGSIFSTFADIVKRAGGPSLSDFASGMRELRDAVKGDWFQTISLTTMTAVFDFLEEFDRIRPEAMKAVATAAGLLVYSLNGLKGPTVDAFGAIFRGFSSPTFINGWTQFIDGIGNFLTDINPGLERFVSELGGLMGIVGVGADSFGEAFNELLILVSNIGANIHPGLEEFLKFVGPELEELILAVGPGLEDMATAISDLLANKGFQLFLSDMNDKLQIAIPFITDMVTGIIDLTTALFDKYEAAPPWLRDVISWAAVGATAFGVLAAAAVPLILSLAKLLTAIKLVLSPIKKLGKALGRLAMKVPPIKAFVTAIKALAAGLKKQLLRLPGILINGIRSMATRFIAALPTALRAMGRGLRTALVGIFKGFGGLAARILAPLATLFRGLGAAFLRILPTGLKRVIAGGLAKVFGAGALRLLVRTALVRFVGVLSGPVGWILLVADLIKPISAIQFTNWVLEKLGLDDTFIGKFTREFQKSVSEIFGDASLIDLALKPFTDAWNSFAEGDWFDAVLGIVSFGADDWLEAIIDAIIEALGLKPSDTEYGKAWVEDGLSGILGVYFKNIFKGIRDTLIDAIEGELNSFLQFLWDWSPIGISFRIFEWLVEKVMDWLGIGGGSSDAGSSIGGNITAALGGNWGESLFEDGFKPWLDRGWSSLLAKILGWGPRTIFNILKWIGSKLGEWLGMAGDAAMGATGGFVKGVGGVLDWGEDVWTNKVKPWLDAGWSTLNGRIDGWSPAGGSGVSGVGTAIDRALGTDPASTERTSKGLTELGSRIGLFTGTVVGKYAEMGTGGKREIEGLADTTDVEFGNVEQSGIGHSLGMKLGVGLNFGEMSRLAREKVAQLKVQSGFDMAETTAQAIAQSGLMKIGVGGNYTGMATVADVKMAAMKAGTITDSIATSLGAIAESGKMKTGVGANYDGMVTAADVKTAAMKASTIGDVIGTTVGAITESGKMETGVTGNYEGMKAKSTAKVEAMKAAVAARMSAMKTQSTAKASAMQSSVVSKMSAMQTQATAKAAAMQTNVISKMSRMQSQATAKAAAMQRQVISRMTTMTSRATSQASRMQSQVVARARHMQAQFVAQMRTMASLALGVASRLRGSLTSALTINASGPGRYTGSTFVSGLSGGLSRAVGVARGMAGRIRGALSFSVYGSGSAVGGSFASGIRSRVGAVASAANALAAAARRRMPNSPAAEGPFSGAGWGGWGESIGEELAKGIRDTIPLVAREADRLVGSVSSSMDGLNSSTPEVRFKRGSLAALQTADGTPVPAAGSTINVNVESKSEDPLQDGRRLGGDLRFALEGAGL